MLSNFLFPYLNSYSQSSLEQILYNQLIYNQFCQNNHLNTLQFFQNPSFENSIITNGKNYPLSNFSTEQQKMVLQTSYSSEQINLNEEKKIISKMDQKSTRQKYGRNITSNIFRCLLKRLSSSHRFKQLALKIIQQKKFTLTYQNFLSEINKLSFKLKSYVKKNEMKRFILPDQNSLISKQFSHVFRILAKLYLKQQHTISIFYSKKISKDSRGLHFIMMRQMESLLK